MAKVLMAGAFVLPGLACAGIVSRYYENIEGRYRFLPFDKALERQISRKIEKTWGQKTILRYNLSENKEISNIFTEVQMKTNLPAGKFYFLDTNEEVFQIFHNGNVYLSKGIVKGLTEEKIKSLLYHQVAHIILRHQQEDLPCLKITSLFLAYLCRNNHHFHYILKNYQLFPKYTETQEIEANRFASQFSDHKNFNCYQSL